MENKQVLGVLRYNNEIRNKMLSKNEGKYSQFDGLLSPAIGEAYQQRELYPHSLTSRKSLLDYTHDGESQYSENICHRNFSDIEERDVFSILSPTNEELQRWGGKYENYLQYISDTYGKELTSVNFVEKLLSTQDIVYGLRQMEVGVLKDIDVANAIAGVVTTNINNFSGTDTQLGLITNEMYAASLFSASQFNTSRKRYDLDSEYPYISPSLYEVYGNNSANVNRLGDIMRPDKITGRITEDPSVDLNIIREWSNYSEILKNNSSVYYANRQVGKNKYQPYSKYIEGFTDGKINESEKTDAPHDFYNDTTALNQGSRSIGIVKTADKEYDEGDTKPQDGVKVVDGNGENQGIDFFTFDEVKSSKDTLLDKTNQLFRKHQIETLISRFHTSSEYNKKYENETFDTAKTVFGKSKGRNLLKLGALQGNYKTNNYSNPYCRVWTYHHQYDKLTKLIRPFVTEENGEEIQYSLNDIQKLNENFRAKGITNSQDGWDYLSEKTVLNKDNGLVNIVPSKNGGVEIKKCMFSIENLAWKDVPNIAQYLSAEQRGPLGGRIMWFPPYDLRFTESVNVGWNSNTFIGRGEKVYTYTDTDRTATLDFTLLIDHPAIINEVRNMEGKDPDGSLDMDILRFFAGCGPLDNGKKKTTDDVDTNKKNNAEASTEPVEVLNEEKSEKLKFYVFFPNNYSGNYNDGNKISEKEWREQGLTDHDWAEYILMGRNTIIPDSIEVANGYEMGNGAISNSGVTDEYITTAVNPNTNLSENWTVFPEYNGDDKGKRRYHYRVDFDLRQKLFTYENYYDTRDYGLNVNFTEVNNCHPDADCTFAEMMAAILLQRIIRNNSEYDYDAYVAEDNENGGNEKLHYIINQICNSNYEDDGDVFYRIKAMAAILNKGVKKIIPIGGATEQDRKNSNLLAYRRSRTLGVYMKNMLGFDGDIDFSQLEDTEELINDKTVNSENAKLQRYASVEIYFGAPEQNSAEDMVSTEGNTIVDKNESKTDEVPKNADTDSEKMQAVHSVVETVQNRYETEADYFDKLQITDPIVFKQISDKYRYFTPAFHSLSPEGFNARLTFLHQCTRQGHTVSTADEKFAKTAGNLSFGRMPVCALRIGDFFYSKVLIQSMSINYESGNGFQWDLNPEGSGVQPMYARISMSLVILGGQTLDGPADRLQNATTFNYYANSGVYDNRADRITISDNGELTYNSVFVPYNKEDKSSKNNERN